MEGFEEVRFLYGVYGLADLGVFKFSAFFLGIAFFLGD